MKYILLFILALVFWVGITYNWDGSYQTVYWIIGAVVSLLTAIVFGRHFLKGTFKVLNPLRYFWLIIYIPIFLWECIKANFDVAYRVIHPALPIKPGIVKVKTILKSDIARVMLANSITMTPGTLSVDITGDTLYIHWINVRSKNPAVYTKMITGRFENLLKRIFE